MKYLTLIATIFALLVGADKPKQDPAVNELEKLQGTWNFVTLEVDGMKLPEAMLKGSSNIVIKGDTFKTITGGVIYEANIRIDAAKNPKTIDFIFTDGPEKGKTSLGIYEVDGDDLKICLGLSRKYRPAQFATTQGSRNALETLKRVKQQ